METILGNNPHSGNETHVEGRKNGKRRRKKKKEAPSNGSTDWKAAALKAQAEVTALSEMVEDLKAEVQYNRWRHSEAKAALDALSKAGLGPRAAAKLSALQSLWGQLVNFQSKCEEDKRRVDALVDAYLPVLKQAANSR